MIIIIIIIILLTYITLYHSLFVLVPILLDFLDRTATAALIKL